MNKMIYMKKILFLTSLLAMCLVSCRNTDLEEVAETGTLKVNLTSLTDYITVETKSDEGGVDYTDFNNYDVVIDGPTKVTEKFSTFSGRVVELGSGSYTITVTSPGTEAAAFEQPIYQDHEAFEIKAGEVTALDLVCEPYNCKVTIELSENFKKELVTYEVTINNGLGELVWTKDETKDDFATVKAGYFLTRGLEVKVKGHRAIDDTEATAVYYVKNPQPAEHHIIKLDAKVTGQIGGITIDVSTDFNPVENEIEVDGMDETYVDRPDFDGSEDEEEDDSANKPSIVWAQNIYFDKWILQATDQIELVINAPLGINEFKVEVSDNFKTAVQMITNSSYVCELDEEGNLVMTEKLDENGEVVYKTDEDGNQLLDENGQPIPVMVPVPVLDDQGKPTPIGADYIDLINHPSAWYQFGLPVANDVKGETEIVFGLTPFIETLCGVAGGQTVQFILKAADVNGNYVMTSEGETPVVTLEVPVL